MGKRLMKVGAILAAGSVMLGWGGCLGGGNSWWGRIASDVALNVATEFVLDNDAVFDLFQDDFGTGALYDDRFTADPTRAEPDEDTQALVDAAANR